jgi:hypothetical protein
MPCTTDDFQPFPQTGRLAENLNLSLGKLREKLRDISVDPQAKVYSYIVATVKNSNGHFVQKGSAPNFQGGVISLCTCKHRMRSFQDPKSWLGTWIAGFTGKEAGNGRNALIYLMKVEFAFDSFYDLWFSEKLTESVKQAKLAHTNRFGDIFQPRNMQEDKFDFSNYEAPVDNHSHFENKEWHKDICYTKGVWGRMPALLFGDAKYSYLWDQPVVFHSERLYHGQRKDSLDFLLNRYLSQRDKVE